MVEHAVTTLAKLDGQVYQVCLCVSVFVSVSMFLCLVAFGYVTFLMVEHAVTALATLDG
jgi:hypothetical protein